MSKRSPAVVDLADYRAKKAEEGSITIRAEGRSFTVLPPVLWPDDFMAHAKANDNLALATAVIGGADEFAAWQEAGGTAALLLDIVSGELGLDLGE